MDFEDFTDMQKIVASISGNDPWNSGARNDAYYMYETKEEKTKQIEQYAENSFEKPIFLKKRQIEIIYKFLETEFKSTAEMELEFMKL